MAVMRNRVLKVGQVALLVSFIAALILTATVAYLTGDAHPGTDYLEALYRLALAERQATAAIVVSGLLIISLTGLVTWAIAVYSSARISGPLYRFEQNMKLIIADRRIPLIHLRRNDVLQEDARALEDARNRLYVHVDQLKFIAEHIQNALDSGNWAEARRLTKKLRDAEKHAKLMDKPA